MKKLIFLAATLVAFGAAPAYADPLTGWLASTIFAWAGTAATALAQIVVGIGTNLLSGAIAKATAKGPKIDVQFDVDLGDDTPLTFVVGDYVTAGKLKYAGSWGRNTRFFTQVFEISALPQGLESLWVDDEPGVWETGASAHCFVNTAIAPTNYTTGILAPTADPIPGHIYQGRQLSNYRESNPVLSVKVIDGTQTAADPFLVWIFGNDPDYPWTEEHIGSGKSYVVVTAAFNEKTLTSVPQFLWKPAPLPMYDPRKDDTAGGVGSHRWGDRSTYEPSANPAVISYNLARGVYLGSEWVFGGRNLAQWRLPLAEWMAAMTASDAAIALAGGGTEPAYRCGAQISVDAEPLAVLEEIGRAANMRYSEVGGMLKPQIEVPGASIMHITDDDIIITEGQSLKPFNTVSETYNALSATYPEPREKWASKDAPEYIDSDAAAEDGQWLPDDTGALAWVPHYLPVSVSYPAAPYGEQVQRLMRAQMREYRRMRLHQFQLPPMAYVLEPLVDKITWTSARNGYVAKEFVVEAVQKLPGMNVAVTLREVDASDYDWSSDFQLPYTVTPPGNVVSAPQTVEDWAASAIYVTDAAGRGRAPAVLVSCAGEEEGVREVRVQLRKEGSAAPEFDLSFPYGAPYAWTVSGVAAEAQYHVRGALISDFTGAYEWSAEISVTTGAVEVTLGDLAAEVTEAIANAQAEAGAAAAAAAQASLDAAGVRDDLNAAVADLTAGYDATQAVAQEAIAARDQTITARDAAQLAEQAAGSAATVAQTARDTSTAAAASAQAALSDAQAAQSSASTSAGLAATSATNAGNSASAAATSASAAGASATNAAQSAASATTARNAAQTAQAGAESAQTSAATSATNAAGSASAAATSATNSAGSATAAGNSASAAAASASAAATSATDAEQSATSASAASNAAQTARAGAESAQASAATSATNAAGSASSATTSASNAANSATTAGNSASAAQASASTATTQASAAAQSATTASQQASAASTSAGNASTFASNAATSANTAATQANAAAASAGVAASTQVAINATVAAIGPSSLGLPVEAWTGQSTTSSAPAAKAPISSSTIKTGDADFGTCFEFGSTGNLTIGPMRVYEYAPEKVFSVTVRFKTVANGTGISNNQIGATLYQGSTIDATEQNQQQFIGNFSVADGVQTKTVWFSARSDIAALALSETGFNRVNLDNPANAANNGVMFHFRQNAGGVGTTLQRVDTFEVRDITATVDAILARDAAGASASAAYDSEQLAAAHRDDAGDYAGVASTQRGLAETAAGAASVSAGQAATSATSAAGSASSAQSYSTLAAQIGPRGASVVADTIFATYGQSGGWANSGAGPTTAANEVYPAGKSLHWNISNASTQSGTVAAANNQWTGARNADAYVVEVDFTLISGSLAGAGVLLDWNSSGENNRAQVALSAMVRGAVVLGQVTTAQAIFLRPTMAGAFTTHDIFLMANYNIAALGGGAVKEIKFHGIRVRVATAEELGQGQVGAQITASVGAEAAARATSDQALAAQINTVSASLGTVSATVTQQSTAIADLEGNASAGYLIRAQAGGAVSLIDLIAADGSGGTPTSVARIAASTILLDGSVGTDQLAVGLGRNLLTNTDFSDVLSGWVKSYSTGVGGNASGIDLKAAGSWAGAYFPTMRVYQTTADSDGYIDVEHHPVMPNGYVAPGVPVTPGDWIDVSAKVSIHRCVFELRIRFYDATGAHLAWSGLLATANAVQSSSTDPEQWPTYWGKMEVPSGAAYATIHLRKKATNAGQANSYLFVHKPQLAITVPNATSAVPFSPGGTTLISGGKIITRSLTAEHLAVGAITAASAVLATASVGTLTIAGGAVTVPVSTFMPGLLNVQPYGTYTSAGVVTINRESFDTHITFNCSLDCRNPGVVMFRIKRNGTVIANMFDSIVGNQTQVSLAYVDKDTGTGVTNYQVDFCQADPAVTGGWNGSMRVFKRLLKVQQLKR